ncbi:MAG: Uma2 family endonuclease [Oscillospiraceae bacterium]|jgi:Uma2 family endonuclease|nr:Uma2 family endonuclease [Oscillospiraceae bacterium]
MENTVKKQYSHWEDKKYEIIDGQVLMLASASPIHNKIALRISSVLENFLKGRRCEAWTDTDVFFDNSNILRPDILVLCDKNKFIDGKVKGAPDFIVEVLSKSTHIYDRGVKKDIYEKYGVKEYWIVSPDAKTIEVYVLNEEKRFEINNVYFFFEKETEECKSDEFITTTLYGDDLKISIKEIFAPIFPD